MEGLGQPHGCESVHDDLFVRALYLAHEGREVLILGYDLVFFERPAIDRYKGAIGRYLDLRPSEILLNASHNHAGPRLTHWYYSDGADPGYLDQVADATVAAAVKAKSAAREATMWAGETRTRLPVSRRKPDGKGKTLWAPHRGGTICDIVPFCVFKDADDAVISLVFSVSCHPSMIYECSISAEYPGAIMKCLNERLKIDGALFLQGAGGDAKPRYVADGEERWRRGTWEEMEAAGAEVADAVIQRIGDGMTPVQPDLKTWMTEVEWPLQPIPPRSRFEEVAKNSEESKARRLWAEEMLRQMADGSMPRAVPIALHAVQLGKGLLMVGLEGEVVGELGNLIVKSCGKGVTFPLGYVDGCQIYLPVSRMLPEGGYEVESYWEYHYPAPLAPGGELEIEKAIRKFVAQ